MASSAATRASSARSSHASHHSRFSPVSSPGEKSNLIISSPANSHFPEIGLSFGCQLLPLLKRKLAETLADGLVHQAGGLPADHALLRSWQLPAQLGREIFGALALRGGQIFAREQLRVLVHLDLGRLGSRGR